MRDLEAENRRLRASLDRILAMTGEVTCGTDAECVGCGCRSLTAEEAVAEMRLKLDGCRDLVEKLGERTRAQSELLSRRSEVPSDA